MVFKDYYKILGLETSRVSIEEIKVAYREQAKKYHPDLNVGDNLAENRIKDINEAYTKLSNPSEKRKYDRMWNSHFGKTKDGKNKVQKDYIFSMFLGNIAKTEENKKAKPQNGENVETKIEATLKEAFFGAEKTIILKNNEGKDKAYSVKLPEGIRNGEKIRLIGQGKKGINGGKDGDLLIEIDLKEDKDYKLKGYDLYTNVQISPWEAALGTKIEITAIDENISISVPKGIQSGENIRVPQKGYKSDKGERGDLFAEVKIVVPTSLTKGEEKLFYELSKISKFKPRKQ